MKEGGFVYIMASQKMGTLYIGSTINLMVRALEHKEKTYKGFTAEHNVNKLVYYEWHDSLEEMVKRERQMKKWKRNWKLKLIIDNNPGWVDLTDMVLKSEGYQPYTGSGSLPSQG
jgi:putative endonuclease